MLGAADAVGMMISWPSEILFGFVIVGFAASRSSSWTSNLLATFESVSPFLMTYTTGVGAGVAVGGVGGGAAAGGRPGGAPGPLALGLALDDEPPPPNPMIAGSMNRMSAAMPSAPANRAARGTPRIRASPFILGEESTCCIRSHDGPAVASRVELTDGRLPVRVDGGYPSVDRTI